MTTFETVLEKHPFFKGIDTPHIQSIAEHATAVHFEAGKLIFRQGEPAQHFYILNQGKVALELFSPERGPLPVMTLSTGDVLGWSWIFEPYIWHFDARALEDTQAIVLDGAALRAEFDNNHELGYQLARHSISLIEQRLQAVMIQLLDIYSTQR